MDMVILLSDPAVAAVPVRECGDALVHLDVSFGPACAQVRRGLADRLGDAQRELPKGFALRVVEGFRSAADQRAIIAKYSAELRDSLPGISAQELEVLTSRFVSPVSVAPHVAGAAVDLTLVDANGTEVDMGTPIDATPEQSDGACYFAAPQINEGAREHRDLLAHVLGRAGLVNYPTEWWHWSFGDRYWALATGAEFAPYGPAQFDDEFAA